MNTIHMVFRAMHALSGLFKATIDLEVPLFVGGFLLCYWNSTVDS